MNGMLANEFSRRALEAEQAAEAEVSKRFKERKGLVGQLGECEELVKKIINFKDDIKVEDKNKEYLKLYKSCLQTVKKNHKKYILSLDDFEKYCVEKQGDDACISEYKKMICGLLDSAQQELSSAKDKNLETYDGLVKIGEKVLDIVKNGMVDGKPNPALAKMLSEISKIDKETTPEELIGKFERGVLEYLGFSNGKSKLLDGLNKNRNEIADQIDEMCKKLKELKEQLSKSIGILSNISLKRNVYQSNDDSPLRVLIKLHDALVHKNEMPKYKNKDLLKMKKDLNQKIEHSMQKVIECNWESYGNARKGLGVPNLMESVKEVSTASDYCGKVLDSYCEGKSMNTLLKGIKEVCDAISKGADEYSGRTQVLCSMLACASACKSYSITLDRFIKSLNATVQVYLPLEDQDLLAKTIIDKNGELFKEIMDTAIGVALTMLEVVFPGIKKVGDKLYSYGKMMTNNEYKKVCENLLKDTSEVIKAELQN